MNPYRSNAWLAQFVCTPTEIQTPIPPLEGACPVQLDDGGESCIPLKGGGSTDNYYSPILSPVWDSNP